VGDPIVWMINESMELPDAVTELWVRKHSSQAHSQNLESPSDQPALDEPIAL
jgi:hypothetical protein